MIGVHFYGCAQEISPSCDRYTTPDLLTIEEIGWQSYSPGNPNYEPSTLEFQRIIDTVVAEMERRMELHQGINRCALLISNRMLTQLHSCVKISKEGCQNLQNYTLQTWKHFAGSCLTAQSYTQQIWKAFSASCLPENSQCSEKGQCTVKETIDACLKEGIRIEERKLKNPVEVCSEVSLPDIRSNHFIKEKIFWVNPNMKKQTPFADPSADPSFSLALDEKVSVKARQPRCKDPTFSDTLAVFPTRTFERANERTSISIKYALDREVDDFFHKKFDFRGGIYIVDYGARERLDRIHIKLINGIVEEEIEIEKIVNRILKLDITALKQLPEVEYSFSLEKAIIRAALLSEHPAVQAEGIKWKQEAEEQNRIRREQYEGNKKWWNQLFRPWGLSP